jgi:hypothetical protein
MDYKNGKIYTLRSPHTDKYYIGSTTTILAKRLYCHKSQFNQYIKGNQNYHYMTSYELFILGEVTIELLEEYSCENKMQLEKREGQLQREHKNNLVNKVIAGVCDHSAFMKEYYIKNKEEIKKKQDEYRKTNKELVNKQNRERYAIKKEKSLLIKLNN